MTLQFVRVERSMEHRLHTRNSVTSSKKKKKKVPTLAHTLKEAQSNHPHVSVRKTVPWRNTTKPMCDVWNTPNISAKVLLLMAADQWVGWVGRPEVLQGKGQGNRSGEPEQRGDLPASPLLQMQWAAPALVQADGLMSFRKPSLAAHSEASTTCLGPVGTSSTDSDGEVSTTEARWSTLCTCPDYMGKPR